MARVKPPKVEVKVTTSRRKCAKLIKQGFELKSSQKISILQLSTQYTLVRVTPR